MRNTKKHKKGFAAPKRHLLCEEGNAFLLNRHSHQRWQRFMSC